MTLSAASARAQRAFELSAAAYDSTLQRGVWLEAQSVPCASSRHYSFQYEATDLLQSIYIELQTAEVQNGIITLAVDRCPTSSDYDAMQTFRSVVRPPPPPLLLAVRAPRAHQGDETWHSGRCHLASGKDGVCEHCLVSERAELFWLALASCLLAPLSSGASELHDEHPRQHATERSPAPGCFQRRANKVAAHGACSSSGSAPA